MVPQKKTGKTRSLMLLLFTVAVGVGLNFLGRWLNALWQLPLYLDNVGTIFASLLGGIVPGVTVGFFSNILNGLNDPYSTYYSVISILIAVAAVGCHRRRILTRFPQILLAIFLFACLGGVVGGTLTWLIYGKQFAEGYTMDLARTISDRLFMGYFSSNLLACFLVDIVDKTAVTVPTVLLFRLVPQKLLDYFRAKSWYLHREERGVVHVHKRTSLSVKMAAAVSLSLSMAMLGAIATSIIQYHNDTIRAYQDKGERVTAILAEMLTQDQVEALLADGKEAEGYTNMVQELDNALRASPEIRFIYAYQITESGCIVVFDMDVPGDPDGETAQANSNVVEGNRPGDTVPHDATIEKYLELFLAEEEIPADITLDDYGWLFSVYRPVYGEDGGLLCYAIADMSMERLRTDEVAYLAKLISLFIAFLLLICVYSIWLTRQSIIQPINTIADAANRFTYGTKEARVRSRKMVEELNITSGDEIEDLYRAYRKTTADMVEYIDEVQHKSNQISNLQNGLILVLADMVESRDQNTGDHVKKTAAYVAIILEQMRKEGIYADKLTDSYIYDVVHSAPLHDVGKITISDAILNKPGKLTKEEFDVMKTHASSGETIIDQVIDTMREESDYLNEAKKLAAYHHEKWDGSGYPEGLKGEEIPLSARVMAVADVFDALISRRSYKEPYTVEDSLKIIRESSGTHFDPQVVKAFLDAEEEVRHVVSLNMEEHDYKQYNDDRF